MRRLKGMSFTNLLQSIFAGFRHAQPEGHVQVNGLWMKLDSGEGIQNAMIRHAYEPEQTEWL
jgi:hypothetical protein